MGQILQLHPKNSHMEYITAMEQVHQRLNSKEMGKQEHKSMGSLDILIDPNTASIE